ncbi:proteasome subunit beta [Streptomyces griseofuscus]|uniref:Proteasome subunit beta n=2 Tax=Streptomyces TaxID=1883 RepID=A0A7W3NWE1_STRMR|nr:MULTISPECIES: proteasome subunit beta [Streptomyces]NDK27823.1 proteasome subunit beta [Streptomyces sp. TR1341]MBA9049938.1 proteasome beta subunit [Streptomyces murinus]MBA9058000.1 proteasome beta subunit [Streptomyces murinus]MBJ7005349.1 proteasome subunit beta [Streptomyces sp. CRPSP2-6A1]QNT90954.1 proteasome subunit beta [Streptomyces griseofuscus]
MTGNDTAGLMDEAFFTPGSSSFAEFLAAHRPRLLPTASPLPPGTSAAPGSFPHGTTVLALTYGEGVLLAGDRRATMGNLIAQRDLEKVHPADDHTAVAFAGTVGLALDMVRLYQVELAHFEKIEGIPMTLGAKATRLATMIRQNLAQAMQGLAVVPLLAGYDLGAPTGEGGRIFAYDAAGGLYEKREFHAEGSGSPYARGALKKLYRPGLTRREAALAALHALYDAADDDSATGGPDLNRRIFPILSFITEDGYERLPEAETEELSREMVRQRDGRPDGPHVAP